MKRLQLHLNGIKMNDNAANSFLFFGSVVLSFFFQTIAYLGITNAQVFGLFFVFFVSGIVGFVKTISFKENVRAFIAFDITSKSLSLFIPFAVAFGAKIIPSIYVFVDYCFSFLILGEILSILIHIQALRTRNPEIKEIDIYNLVIKRFREFIGKILRIDENEKKEKECERRNDEK